MSRTLIKLLSLDIYRDGGSLNASFLDLDHDIQYCLFFPIKDSPAFDPGIKDPTFKSPILESYVKSTYSTSLKDEV